MEINQNEIQLEFDSKAEEIVFSYLKEIVSDENYMIKAHCALTSVFDYNQDALIDKFRHFCLLFFNDKILSKSNFLENDTAKTHFDFVIFTKKFQMPTLFIEVNGSTHLTDPKKIMMDSFKLALSQSKSIPLIVIPLYKKYTENEIYEILQGSLSEINVKKAFPAYCPQCGNRLGINRNRKFLIDFYYCSKCKGVNKSKSKTFNIDDIPLFLK